MTMHKPAAWATLGQAVHEARKEMGLGKTRDWAATVGRSERTLLELERGGKVGTSTLEDIEDALGWPRAGAYRVLNGLPWRSLVVDRSELEGAPNLAAAIERIERRLTQIEQQLGKVGTGDVAPAAQKSDDLGDRRRRREELSAPDAMVAPAALDTVEGVDEKPGGSDYDEG